MILGVLAKKDKDSTKVYCNELEGLMTRASLRLLDL